MGRKAAAPTATVAGGWGEGSELLESGEDHPLDWLERGEDQILCWVGIGSGG